MRIKLSLLLVCCYLATCLGWDPKKPEPKNDANWKKHHETLLKKTEHDKDHIKVVFIGASVMEYWQTEGKQIWDSYYVKRNAADYGIAGDTTSNVLWRVENHELDGLKPKVIVLQVGYNNFDFANNEQIHEGVEEVVKQIRHKCPDSKIINIGLLPLKDEKKNSRVKPINQLLAKSADNKHVFYLDVGPQMRDSNGHQKSGLFRADGIHPTLKGYEVWQNEMKPLFEKLYQD